MERTDPRLLAGGSAGTGFSERRRALAEIRAGRRTGPVDRALERTYWRAQARAATPFWRTAPLFCAMGGGNRMASLSSANPPRFVLKRRVAEDRLDPVSEQLDGPAAPWAARVWPRQCLVPTPFAAPPA